MSASFTVNKGKRPRTPNDPNNSFVKNVTSRMSALLPSSITKWFSSPSSSKSNGSAPSAESTDSSTEDEALESPVSTQPPAKRMRYSSPGTSQTYNAPEMKCMSTNTEPIETYSEVQSPITRNTFRPETNFVSTPLHSHSKEIVSSGSSNNKETTYHMDNSVSSENNSVIRKRKSLFNVSHEEKSYERNPFSKINKPYFNASAYTAAPFYPKRTKYSGVSSAYINYPNVKNRKNTSVTNSNSSNNDINTISHSARRVLDLLENYSSPLIEAKRLSQLLKTSSSNCLNNSEQDCSVTSNNKGLSYKRQELHVPSIATMLRIKQRSRLMDTTSAARQIIASHSSSSDAMLYPTPEMSRSAIPKETGEKLTTKIKSRLTRINREDKIHANDEPVNLPTAVLHIDKDNLPKFSLGAPAPKPPSNSTASSTETSTKTYTPTPTVIQKVTQNNKSKSDEVNINNPGKASNKNTYQFSSPVTVSNETVTNSTTHSKFTFGSPERAVERFSEKSFRNNSSSDAHSQVVPEITESIQQPEKWKCNDCWVFNKHDIKTCVCCGKKPENDNLIPKKCSECKSILEQGCISKCNDCQKKSFVDIVKPLSTDLTQCKCRGADKCVCFGSKQPAPIDSSSAKVVNIDVDWKCDICWIKNKCTDEKCAACGAENPTPKSSNTKSNKELCSVSKTLTTDSMLKNIVKTQSGKWECSNCLVRNESNVSKCVCCETEKPGTIKESAKKSFNFGDVPNTTFKFGIDPKQNTVENKPEPTSKTPVSPETNNNTLPTTFTFGLPNKISPETKNDEQQEKEETSKPAFSFGIPKETPNEQVAKGFSLPNFGVSKLSPETPKTLPQKVAQENIYQNEPPKTTGSDIPQTSSLFSAPVLSQPATSSEQTFNSPLPITNTPSNQEKIETTDKNLSLIPKITASLETSSPGTFSFSSSGIKPAANLFSPQVTSTSATTTSTFSPIQASPTTSSISYFQKSNPVITSPLSFFQKSDPAPAKLSLFNNKSQTTLTTAASQSAVSSTPVFSFGTSNTQNPTQSEKPKFNFTFGSTNKSEGLPPYSNIGANSNTNTFGLTNQNTIGTGSMLSGNTLGGMASNNSVPGNILTGTNNALSTGNTLGAMPPTGNGLDSGNILGRMGLSNSMNTNRNMTLANNTSTNPSSGSLFGSTINKDMWSGPSNTSNNMFVSNTINSNNNVQKTPSFSFGSSTPFNSNKGNTPTFGSQAQPQPQPQPQPPQNLFGISSPNSQQPSLFSNQMQNPAAPVIFGSQPPASNPVPSVGIFGNSNIGVTPTFGSPNPMHTFEATMNATPAPAPAPAFNFGAQQQPPAIFGFGQQAQQPASGGVYNFGAQPAGMAPAQVQFNMGSAPNIAGRRVRKAIRRTTIR